MVTLPSAAPPPPKASTREGQRFTAGGDAIPIHRPWGWFETLVTGTDYLVKRITILAGRRLSLQRHHHRREHWVVAGGDGLLEVSGQRFRARPGTTLEIPLGAVHRASAACGSGPLVIIEVQRGSSLREDDIERLADDYGRVIPTGRHQEGARPADVLPADVEV